MARKKLNKKVALIGSVVFLLVVFLVIAVFLYLSRNPYKYIEDGDAALAAARQATDEEVRETQYDEALRNYRNAFGLAKTDELKVEMLFKLGEVSRDIGKWRDVQGCWNRIVRIDPQNAMARLAQLRYFEVMADSGAARAWQEVASQASEFIEVVEASDSPSEMFAEELTNLDAPAIPEKSKPGQRLGPYLYLLRGKGNLELTKQGAVTDKEQSFALAVADLEKARELDPDNIKVYSYLAEAAIERGDILAGTGKLEERKETREEAVGFLEKAVEIVPQDVNAHANLLMLKLRLARTGDSENRREAILSLEPEFLSLVEKFKSDAKAYAQLSAFYDDVWFGVEYLDQAIDAIDKAIELAPQNVGYAINAAGLYYRRYSVGKQKPDLYRAISIAQEALKLPDAQEVEGPRLLAGRTYQGHLNSFLANCYIEQVLEPATKMTESEEQKLLADAEQVVHEIEQLYGSGEDPQVVKWQGMLELAKARLGKGDRAEAIRKLYATYEQLKASRRFDPRLSYRLAKAFENSSETGAVIEFLYTALNSGIQIGKPHVLLDYAEALMRIRAWRSAQGNIEAYEQGIGPNARSRELRIQAYIGEGDFEKADERLSEMGQEDPNRLKLEWLLSRAKLRRARRALVQQRRAERIESGEVLDFTLPDAEEEGQLQFDESLPAQLDEYGDALAQIAEKLLAYDPNFVNSSTAAYLCNEYISKGNLERAEAFADSFLQHFPSDPDILFYKRLLAEPDPQNVSEPRHAELREQAILGISDPLARALNLGLFYRSKGETQRAVEQLENVLSLTEDKRDEEGSVRNRAASYLLEIALQEQDWQRVERMVELARREDFDQCGGRYLAARVAFIREQYQDALTYVDEALRRRPVFAYGYLLRGRIHKAIGNDLAFMKDVSRASELNPMDAAVAKRLADALCTRNQKLGESVSSAQVAEARAALERAMGLNPNDVLLLSFYAEYIGDSDPARALAIRQYLLRAIPNVQNALLLARLATSTALEEEQGQRREALLSLAASALEQARKYEPGSQMVVESYAEFYRLTGREQEAERMLSELQDTKLIWRHYIRAGRFADARTVLEQAYRSNPADPNVLTALIFVSDRTGDRDSVRQYSEELLSRQTAADDYLLVIQTFLKMGLVEDAEQKLESFREKYPDETRGLLLGAWLAMKRGRLNEALDLANQYLERDQSSAVAWRVRGEIHRLLALYEQAIIDLNKSMSLFADPSTRVGLAKAYMRSGRPEEAITELKSAIADPQAPEEARALLERIYQRLGRKEVLRQFYEQTLKELPDSVFWLNQAAKFASNENDYSKAEQLYGRAWEISREKGSGNLDSLSGYLQALISGEKLNKVFEEGGKYIDTAFAPVVYFRMAQAKLRLGDKIGAIEYCRKAVDKAGADERMMANVLERVYRLLGVQQAEKLCEEKLVENPDSLAANWTMFNLKKLSGEYNKAAGHIDKCLQIAGSDSPQRVSYTTQKAEVLILAYNKSSDNRYLEAAIKEYESLLVEMPKNTSVLNNLAYILAENDERLDEALEYAKRAHEAKPDDPGFLDTYAFVLYKNGNHEEASENLQAALQQYEAQRLAVPPDVYVHLGQVYEALGQMDNAIDAYEQVLETGEDGLPKPLKQRIESTLERLKAKVRTE